MEDVQNNSPKIAINIDKVGINKFSLPIQVQGKDGTVQQTVAEAALSVDLSKDFKGTHMSRLVDCLIGLRSPLSLPVLEECLFTVKERLEAQYAHIDLAFPYFIEQRAPVTGEKALHSYKCCFGAELHEKGVRHTLDITVPVMTVCPCSKAISDGGAHSQRADIRASMEMLSPYALEDIVTVLEKCGSSPTYPLLKREDEKFVTESSFANPCFVEDAVRRSADALEKISYVGQFWVEVESYESIHGHNAFARIDRVAR